MSTSFPNSHLYNQNGICKIVLSFEDEPEDISESKNKEA